MLMNFMKQLKKWLIIIFVFAVFVWVFGFNWSYVFKKSVVGEVEAVEKVNGPLTVVTGSTEKSINSPLVSFSVAIKDRHSGEIFMASSEDRQWAAVSKGNCVVAVYFPYPPWQIDKANTMHNARLLRNFTSCAQLPEQDAWIEKIKFFFLIP